MKILHNLLPRKSNNPSANIIMYLARTYMPLIPFPVMVGGAMPGGGIIPGGNLMPGSGGGIMPGGAIPGGA
jgi:hypothetical protein